MSSLSLLALAATATLFTACTDPDDADDAPAPTDEHVLAEFERPTDDGLAHYVFRFVEDDGAIATLVGTPLGYPAPVDDPCALDTFLKVAPDDAVVPLELRRACGDVGDPSPRRVADLRTPALTFAVKPLTAETGAGPFCTSAAYSARASKMLDAAKTVQPVYDIEWLCDVEARLDLDEETCERIDVSSGATLGSCDFGAFYNQCGEVTPCCAEGHFWKGWRYDLCTHPVTAATTPVTWADWEGNSGYGASKFQAEVSACVPNATTVISWKKRNSINEAWGPNHETIVNGGYWWVLKLDSGTAPDGTYRGALYVVHATGTDVRPAFVAAIMQGMDRTTCPVPFPL